MAYAEAKLWRMGYRFAATPDSTVTHLLLGVPAFNPDGTLKGGGDLESLLAHFNKDVTVVGGNLPKTLQGYSTVDLLQDDLYLAENADITAHCALKLVLQKLPITLKGCPVLVIGWGRIGKCLAKLFAGVGAQVTVAARKSSDLAMASALGYNVTQLPFTGALEQYRLILNTAPAVVLTQEQLSGCPSNCLKIDLASLRGLEAEDVIWARGLPNSHAPETSGGLIAQTILRLTERKECSR